MKNKIFLILTIIILLVSVFTCSCFAIFGGQSNGTTVYSADALLIPDYLYFSGLTLGELESNDLVTLPMSSLYNYYRAPFMSMGSTIYSSTSDADISYSFEIEQTPDANFTYHSVNMYDFDTFSSVGIRYRNNSVAFETTQDLTSYLSSVYYSCPTILYYVDGETNINFRATVTLYDGREQIDSHIISVSAPGNSYMFSSVRDIFLKAIADWVVLEHEFADHWYSLSIHNATMYCDGDFSVEELYSIQCATLEYSSDVLPDGISFMPFVDTEIKEEIVYKYDLNPLQFIWDTLNSLFAIELFQTPLGGYLTLGELVMALLGVYGLVIIFKAFAGG